MPQIVLKDPDYFFWAMDERIFRGKGKVADEAVEINRKARAIRVPQNGKEKLVVEYAIHQPTGKFISLEFVPESRPRHRGATPTMRSKSIDLNFPRNFGKYDKLGCKNLIDSIKAIIIGTKGKRLTKNVCEAFFENDDNFDLKSKRGI